MANAHRLSLAAAVAASLGACTTRLPPAAPPASIPPSIAAPPAAPAGTGRVVIDVVDGPTPVHRVQMMSEPVERPDGRVSYRFFEAPEILCERTPCVADVPAGNVLLGFPVIGHPGALEVELVYAEPAPSVYRRTLAWREGGGGVYTTSIVGIALGGTAVVAGASLLPIGLAKDKDGLTTAGAITLAAGALLTTLGIIGARRTAPVYRPGASVHFPLEP